MTGHLDPWGDPYPLLDWPRHCQLCGDPLTPGQDDDTHPECQEQADRDELEDAARTLADLEATYEIPPGECHCEASPPEFGGNLPDRECPLHAERTVPPEGTQP